MDPTGSVAFTLYVTQSPQVTSYIYAYFIYKMYNKFSFYSIVVQTVAPEGSSATEGLKEMHIRIEIVTRLNDCRWML